MFKLGRYLILILLLLLGSGGSAGAQPNLDGAWYDSEGQLVLTIRDGYVNGCKILSTFDFVGGNPGACTLRIEEAGGFKDLHVGFYTYDATDTHNYLVLEGKRALRRTLKPRYFESIGGIYIGMSQKQLRELYGSPSRENEGEWYYDKEELTVEFLGDLVSSVSIFLHSPLHFDRSGLKCDSSPAAFQKYYQLDRLPKEQLPPGESEVPYAIGHGEYIFFNPYPKSVGLTIYYT